MTTGRDLPIAHSGHLVVVGAGLPRTGTSSLKRALEQLIGGRCYHMREFAAQPEHGASWVRALAGDYAPLADTLHDFNAAVDWPASVFWSELALLHPGSTVVLSHRESPERWWKSADATVFEVLRVLTASTGQVAELSQGLIDRVFGPDWDNADRAMTAYEQWNTRTRTLAAPHRLIEWQPSDGWEPLCIGLGIDIPDNSFPFENTTDEFRALAGFDTRPDGA